MAVKRLKKRHSSKVISLVLAVAFGLVALVLTYAAVTSQSSTDLRSKAAQEAVVVKGWELNGTDSEGWVGENMLSLKTETGMLVGLTDFSGKRPTIKNTNVEATLPRGVKRIRLQFAVARPSPRMPEIPPGPTPPPDLLKGQFKLNIRYLLKGKKTFEPVPLVITGMMDGKQKVYEAVFPETLKTLKVERIRLEFPDLVKLPYTQISIDWIRLIAKRGGGKPPVSPTPPEGAVVKEGTILKKIQEGQSPYRLAVSQSEFYWLISDYEEGAGERVGGAPPRGRRWPWESPQKPELSGVNLELWVGRKVRVTGILYKFGAELPMGPAPRVIPGEGLSTIKVLEIKPLDGRGYPPPEPTPLEDGGIMEVSY